MTQKKNGFPFLRRGITIGALSLFLAANVASGQTDSPDRKLELTLEGSIEIALERSLSLAIAREKVEEARAVVGEARANFFPRVTGTSSYTRLDVVPYISMEKFPLGPPGSTPSRIEIGDDDNYSAVFSAQQPLFTGFKILNGYKIAEYGAQAEKFNYRKAEADLIFDVHKSFYGMLKAQEVEKVSEQAVAQMEAHVRDLENMYEVGMVARNDLLKGRVQLSNVKLMRIKAGNGVRLAKVAFCNVLGIPLDTDIALKAELKYEPTAPIDLDQAIYKALINRPEVEAMRSRLKMGQKAVSISRAQWLPNIYLVGNYNYKRPNREYEPKFYRSWDVTVALQLNIWDWGTIHYQTSQAKHRLLQMEERFKQLQNGITLEVTQTYLALAEAQERVGTTEKNVGQAEENYRVTDEKFKQGMATNADLLDANTLLTQAKMDYISALADYSIAKAELKKAMGLLEK